MTYQVTVSYGCKDHRVSFLTDIEAEDIPDMLHKLEDMYRGKPGLRLTIKFDGD